MQNNEIFEILEKEYDNAKIINASYCISTLYDIKFNAAKTIEASEEYDYERQWWMNKHLELINLYE